MWVIWYSEWGERGETEKENDSYKIIKTIHSVNTKTAILFIKWICLTLIEQEIFISCWMKKNIFYFFFFQINTPSSSGLYQSVCISCDIRWIIFWILKKYIKTSHFFLFSGLCQNDFCIFLSFVFLYICFWPESSVPLNFQFMC